MTYESLALLASISISLNIVMVSQLRWSKKFSRYWRKIAEEQLDIIELLSKNKQ